MGIQGILKKISVSSPSLDRIYQVALVLFYRHALYFTEFDNTLGQPQSLEYFLSVPPCVFPRIGCCYSSPFHSPALSSWMGDCLGLQSRLVIPNGRERQTYPLLFLFKQMVQCSKASASEDLAASVSHHTLFTTLTVLQSLGNRLFSFFLAAG